MPHVSVCLPVYNGQQYVQEAITSVLHQTWSDLELVISDNASVDGTGEQCRKFAASEPRVHYHPASSNRGLAWNFNRAFQLARGRYVMWMGHDDVLDPDYLRQCVRVLEHDSECVICFSYQNHIDETGNTVSGTIAENRGGALRASDRFCNLIKRDHGCDPVFGLMRRTALVQTGLHGGYAGSDRVLLAEMGLRGRFSLIPRYLFARRMHSQGTTLRFRRRRERSLVFDPGKAGTIFFPFLLKARALATGVNRAQLSWTERMRCYRHLLCWLYTYREEVRWDVQEGLVQALERHVSVEQISRLRAAKRRLCERSSQS